MTLAVLGDAVEKAGLAHVLGKIYILLSKDFLDMDARIKALYNLVPQLYARIIEYTNCVPLHYSQVLTFRTSVSILILYHMHCALSFLIHSHLYRIHYLLLFRTHSCSLTVCSSHILFHIAHVTYSLC